MLKLGPLVLPRALCKAHLRTLKSGLCFWLSGAPEITQMTVFQSLDIWWRMGRMHHKLAQFVVTDGY